ncbi:MAG TPA: type II toxin-antitoxin system MqsA family antitoxin [Burkholderiales bacterium]|nr:type II toxin-antitoxin system MqsA family antitoxin [Burkholderiales bacterium]
MKCLVCRRSETRAGKATVTLERHGVTFVFNDVPAQVCPDCGEDYMDESVTGVLLEAAEEMAESGIRADVVSYHSLIHVAK